MRFHLVSDWYCVKRYQIRTIQLVIFITTVLNGEIQGGIETRFMFISIHVKVTSTAMEDIILIDWPNNNWPLISQSFFPVCSVL